MRKSRLYWLLACLMIISLIVACGGGGGGGLPTEMTLVSNAPDGTQGDNGAYYPSISADGRHVAFESDATNLVEGDTNNTYDIFVRDMKSGKLALISNASDGTQGDNSSDSPSISADGRYVAFSSYARNLVEGDTTSAGNIFVRNMQSGTLALISNASDGTQGDDASFEPSISADGKYVAFRSYATNLIPGETNNRSEIYVRDIQAGTITLISNAPDGTQGDNSSGHPSISADGRYVAFVSFATNLVEGDTNGNEDIFIRDMQSGTIALISNASDGTQGDNLSARPSVSGDGRHVAFESDATNLVPGDTNNAGDIFVRDIQAGTLTLISNASDGTVGDDYSESPSISASGRYVAFTSIAANLVPGDTNVNRDIFIRDMQSGTTTLISVSSVDGTQGNGGSDDSSISADGRYVAFMSDAMNFVEGDINNSQDIFFTPVNW